MRNTDNREGERERSSLSPLERMVAKAIGESIPLGCDDDPLRAGCPELWRWLTHTGEGSSRVFAPAKLALTMTPGGVIVSLSSTSLACSIDCSALYAHGAFEAMEAALLAPAPAFRVWDGRDAKVRKRRDKD